MTNTDLNRHKLFGLDCWCWKCADKEYERIRNSPISQDEKRFIFETRHFMRLCPECGNKRCPKASDHELACTNSNEPGQPGSVY